MATSKYASVANTVQDFLGISLFSFTSFASEKINQNLDPLIILEW
jgi:hypothetical protein